MIESADVKRLMADGDLGADIAKALLDNPDAMDSLADDIADELGDELEDDPELKKQIIDAAVANADFKKRLVQKLVKDMDD